MNFPELETQRLYLKQVTADDAEAYESGFSHYQVIRYLSESVPWPYPKGGVASFLESKVIPLQGVDQWMWGLWVKSQQPGVDRLIGAVHLWRAGIPEHRGFWLAESEWGRGYMTEACEAVNHCAFERLGFTELIFSNAVGNVASRRIKEKTGCELVDILPGRFVDPTFTQREIWRLTRERWERLSDSKAHSMT